MFGERQINLQLTERANDFIERNKVKSGLQSPILGLGWGTFSKESEERWSIGFYGRKDVREGWLGITPTFEFVVIQEWILDAVDNRIMDIDHDKGIVTFDPPVQVEAQKV